MSGLPFDKIERGQCTFDNLIRQGLKKLGMTNTLNKSKSGSIQIRVFPKQLHIIDQNKTPKGPSVCANDGSTQFCRIKGCGGAPPPPPPPIIFERLKLPQQIIYRRKGNLSESPNHQKYLENILISRFYEQFSRSSRILGHFWKKFQTLRTKTYHASIRSG